MGQVKRDWSEWAERREEYADGRCSLDDLLKSVPDTYEDYKPPPSKRVRNTQAVAIGFAALAIVFILIMLIAI